jgi:hypothetical protein
MFIKSIFGILVYMSSVSKNRFSYLCWVRWIANLPSDGWSFEYSMCRAGVDNYIVILLDVSLIGINQMKCLDCPLKYTGPTERIFNIRYKERIHDIRSNNRNSGYSSHILNTGHIYGTIYDTTDVITTGRKGKHLNNLERYHIYRISKDNLHINDTYNDTQYPIFEI